jgi:metal-responsive CopG/Arc/MetJ family transcriptional regulator
MWIIIHIIVEVGAMKTIQMTIDETLLQRVDQTVEDLQTTRSAFIRLALEQALRQYHVRRLEERDEIGYTAVPATASEIEEWETEQEWGDEWNGEK